MPDNYIAIRENNRRITRGGTFDADNGLTEFQVGQDEVAIATIDMDNWIGSATITTVALTNSGLTATEAHGTDTVTITVSEVSYSGTCDALITVSDGRKRMERLRFVTPQSAYPGSNDYGWVRY